MFMSTPGAVFASEQLVHPEIDLRKNRTYNFQP